MPMNARARMRAESRITRITGETVTLLISAHAGVPESRATADDIISEQVPAPASADTQSLIYARVSYKEYDTLSFDEGGRVKQRRCSIEAPADYYDLMHACYGWQLEDGTIYRKKAEMFSDGRTTFILHGDPYVNQEM